MTDESVVGQDTAQIGMPLEHDAIQIEGLALEPAGRGPDLDHRRHHRQVVVGAEHPDPDALVVCQRQQLHHHGKARAFPGAVAIIRIIHAAQVDQLFEAAIGVIPQRAHGGSISLWLDDERQLTQAHDGLDERLAENVFQANGE